MLTGRHKIEKKYVITGRKMVEAIRKRLLKLKKDDPDWWNDTKRSNWAREQFGENLTEKDGFTYPSGSSFEDHGCNVCGRVPKPDTPILKMEFSFCEEYGCEIVICKGCLKEMYKMVGGEK